MSDRPTIRGRAVGLAAILTLLSAPWALAGVSPAPLGVESGAGEILRAGYHLQRHVRDAGTVTVEVLRGSEVLSTATGRAEAPAQDAGENQVPGSVRSLPEADPVVASIDSERMQVNTP